MYEINKCMINDYTLLYMTLKVELYLTIMEKLSRKKLGGKGNKRITVLFPHILRKYGIKWDLWCLKQFITPSWIILQHSISISDSMMRYT
jgi:hypothetical protein